MPDSDKIDAHPATAAHPRNAEIQAIRTIVLAASGALAERIKWNGPSFYHRASKKDFAAINLRATERVHLVMVFHGGTMIAGRRGLLEGDYKDRRMAYFFDMNDLAAKRTTLEAVVREWVALVEGLT